MTLRQVFIGILKIIEGNRRKTLVKYNYLTRVHGLWQEIFNQYGLSLSQAVNIFLTQSVLNRGIPFNIKIPNDETLQAMKDVESGENYEDITLEDLK